MTDTKPGFKPGQSGNPAGRPKGSRNRSTLALEAIFEGEVEGYYDDVCSGLGRKARRPDPYPAHARHRPKDRSFGDPDGIEPFTDQGHRPHEAPVRESFL